MYAIIATEMRLGWAWWHTPFNPSTQEVEAGRFLSRGQPGLQSEFQNSQGYTEKPCFKKQKQKKERNETGTQSIDLRVNGNDIKIKKQNLFFQLICKGNAVDQD